MGPAEPDNRSSRRTFALRLVFWLFVALGIGAVVFVALSLLLVSGGLNFGDDLETPICATTATPQMTGDLQGDIVGAWNATTGEENWHHPLAYIAGKGEEGDPLVSNWPGGRTWMFRSDGTGHVWWAYSVPGNAYSNDEEFVWDVAEDRLIVNDLPPAELLVLGEDALILTPIDESEDPNDGVVLRACDLDVPKDVRGFDS